MKKVREISFFSVFVLNRESENESIFRFFPFPFEMGKRGNLLCGPLMVFEWKKGSESK